MIIRVQAGVAEEQERPAESGGNIDGLDDAIDGKDVPMEGALGGNKLSEIDVQPDHREPNQREPLAEYPGVGDNRILQICAGGVNIEHDGDNGGCVQKAQHE